MSRRTLLLSLLFLLLITLPYVAAARLSGPDRIFGGFLLNPQDGNTYLAKMYQGWRGGWRFTLPFTAEPGQGAYLFLLYYFLGHAARWTGLPLIWVFHLARVLSSILLLWALRVFYRRYSPGAGWGEWAFTTAIFCLGLGWLLLPSGIIPSDFWVAEAYPFLSAFANPHFALSLALLVWLLTLPQSKPDTFWRGSVWQETGQVFLVLIAAALLSLLSPFGVILAGFVLAGMWGLEVLCLARPAGTAGNIRTVRGWKEILACLWQPGSPALAISSRLAALALGGLPFLLYYAWIIRHDPQLAAWNAQNQTLTPPAWDVALALSPVLLLALPTAWWSLRRRPPQASLLMVWAAVGLAFIYFPLNLQRRFMMGLFVPLVGLAAFGLYSLAEAHPRRARLFSRLAIILALPSALLILLLGFFGARIHDPALYRSRSEADGLQWIANNTPADALVLASPQLGLLIPAVTGRRVIYGHPYETTDAAAERAAVESFFGGGLPDPRQLLAARGVDYIFYGPRERELGELPAGLPIVPVFNMNDVSIYRVAAP